MEEPVMVSILDACCIIAAFQCLLYRASMTRLTHVTDDTLKFLEECEPNPPYHVLWRAGGSQNAGWDLSRCWVLGWCLLQQLLLTCSFQIQPLEFIQPLLHKHGPSARYVTGSLAGTTPEAFWARTGSGALHWPSLASAALYGADENNSSGFRNGLAVMLSHACNRFWIYFPMPWFPPCKIAASTLCCITRHLKYKLEGSGC